MYTDVCACLWPFVLENVTKRILPALFWARHFHTLLVPERVVLALLMEALHGKQTQCILPALF